MAKMSARQIVLVYTENRMSSRPDFYSGRGAILSDLDSDLLERIYKGVKNEIGNEAAENFVQMVADIKILSATCFLNTLYGLEVSKWVWKKSDRPDRAMDHIDLPHEHEGRFEAGMATIGAVLGGGLERDETHAIRGEFLQKHGKSVPGSRCNYWQ